MLPIWWNVRYRHCSCVDTWSFANNLKKYSFFSISSETSCFVTAPAAAFDISPNGLSRNVTMRFKVFGSARHVKKDSTCFGPLMLKMFSKYNLKQKTYLKSIGVCVQSRDELIDTPLAPPSILLDNIFKSLF
jgi:hypothetical protein